MADKFIVEGALCTCQFGTTPARIKVLNATKLKMNGGKKVVDTMNLGPCFDAPMFTMCNMVPNAPKPCAAAITQWSGGYTNMKINHIASPLLPNSKGTCALGVPQCISFTFEGQIGIPTMPQMKNSATEFMSDMDPCGESLAMNDAQIGAFKLITLK